MPIVRNTLILAAAVTAPAVVAPPILYFEPDPDHREKMERQSLSQLAYAGKGLYENHCADCHGEEGHGTIAGPSLHDEAYRPKNLTRKAFHQAVTRGVPAQRWTFGDMPANRKLGFNDIEKIARYVREIQAPARYK